MWPQGGSTAALLSGLHVERNLQTLSPCSKLSLGVWTSPRCTLTLGWKTQTSFLIYFYVFSVRPLIFSLLNMCLFCRTTVSLTFMKCGSESGTLQWEWPAFKMRWGRGGEEEGVQTERQAASPSSCRIWCPVWTRQTHYLLECLLQVSKVLSCLSVTCTSTSLPFSLHCG